MKNAEKQALRRIRKTRCASHLTRGSDDYDHKGLNRARRDHGKAIVRSWTTEPTEATPEPAKATETTFRVVVQSQVYENYGAHCCECESDETCECEPYWKAKGGSEYHHNIGTASDAIRLGSKGIGAVADAIKAKFERCDRFWHEYAINWTVVPSTEETYDEQMYREMHEEGWMGHETEEQHAKCMASLVCPLWGWVLGTQVCQDGTDR